MAGSRSGRLPGCMTGCKGVHGGWEAGGKTPGQGECWLREALRISLATHEEDRAESGVDGKDA